MRAIKIYLVLSIFSGLNAQVVSEHLYHGPSSLSMAGSDIAIPQTSWSAFVNPAGIEKQKNLSLWIESAFKIASKKNNVIFNLIGYGSELKTIKTLVSFSKYKEKFNFYDKVNYENLSIHFLKNHLLLLTSFYEGFGRVILEAMNLIC